MTYEFLAILLLVIAVVLILLEFVWLYVVSQKQEDFFRKRDAQVLKARTKLEAVLASPTMGVMEVELEDFFKLCQKSDEDMVSCAYAYVNALKNYDNLNDLKKQIMDEVYQQIDFVGNLKRILKKSSTSMKSYICRCLADLKAVDAIEDIRKAMRSKNKILKYNAGMALSQLGDEEGVIEFLSYCETNNHFSHRVIMELFDIYGGDEAALVRHYFSIEENKDEYMKATIIKSIKDESLVSIKDILIEGYQKKNSQVRVACIKGLASIATPDLEQYLISAASDKHWLLRLSAITGMEKIGSEKCLDMLKKLTMDDEWWVRKRAAQALVRVDSDFERVEEVINGFDRYASEVVKESLYKAVD